VIVRWTALARTDLLAIFDYVVARNPRAALRLFDEIKADVRGLIDYPRIGRPGRRPNTRELVISGTPYIVSYRLKGREIQVLRVLHGARRWPEKL
jgi:addiction module RelE/StbE family toxin